jgi:hypothetical protein
MIESQQRTVEKYLLERIVNEGESEHLHYYLVSLFEAVCRCLPYHAQKLTWRKLHDLIVNGASGSYWGFKWNIYTAYIINYVFDNGDRRYRFALDNTLKDFPDSTGRLVKCNAYKMQDILLGRLSTKEDGFAQVYPINTDWTVCHPASTVFNIKTNVASDFIRDYKTYVKTIKLAQEMFMMGAQGKISKLVEEIGDEAIFGSRLLIREQQELYNKSEVMKRLFDKLKYAHIKYDSNHLLPLYGLNL